MKTLTKILTAITVMTLSLGVYAHMGNYNGKFGANHPMMNKNNPQYQAMLERHKNPEAMRDWMQQMIDDPEAMQLWMEQMHDKKFTNRRGGFGCQGNRFNTKNTTEE